jgi:hypothetical protein
MFIYKLYFSVRLKMTMNPDYNGKRRDKPAHMGLQDMVTALLNDAWTEGNETKKTTTAVDPMTRVTAGTLSL